MESTNLGRVITERSNHYSRHLRQYARSLPHHPVDSLQFSDDSLTMYIAVSVGEAPLTDHVGKLSESGGGTIEGRRSRRSRRSPHTIHHCSFKLLRRSLHLPLTPSTRPLPHPDLLPIAPVRRWLTHNTCRSMEDQIGVLSE